VLKPENYFDNAATTPVDPRVIREMLPYLETNWGNANSLHAWGREAMNAVDHARERVASMLFAEDPSQIVFTSGATESNNWVLSLHDRIAISPFEHSAVLEPAKARSATILQNRDDEVIPPVETYDLISVIETNNEIGTRFAPDNFRSKATYIHSDITQAAGKYLTGLRSFDYASLSAHKFYGPKGVGALYAKHGPPSAMIKGGDQEQGSRGGTLNVPGIVGMGAAAAIAQDEWPDNLDKVIDARAVVLETLTKCPDHQTNASYSVSPYILSVSFKGLEGETLVIELDQQGFGISSGAACSSRSADPSHVLTALKMPIEWLRGTIRISFGRLNTKQSALELGRALVETVERLRNLRTI